MRANAKADWAAVVLAAVAMALLVCLRVCTDGRKVVPPSGVEVLGKQTDSVSNDSTRISKKAKKQAVKTVPPTPRQRDFLGEAVEQRASSDSK